MVRINAEFADQTSDHDPLIASLHIPAAPQHFTLQLLHLSDGEAGLLASQTAPNLAALVDAYDDDYANTLILSGGDNFLPGPFLAAGTDLSVTAALNAATGSTIAANANIPIGAVDIAILNSIGVEASTLGNHEFDLGSRVLRDAFYAEQRAGVGRRATSPTCRPISTSPVTPISIRVSPTRWTAARARWCRRPALCEGRIAPATVITEGGEQHRLCRRDHPAPGVDLLADRDRSEGLPDRPRRQWRSRRHGAAGAAAAADHRRDDRRGCEQDHRPVAPAEHRQRAAARDLAARRRHHPGGRFEHAPCGCGRRTGGVPRP